MINLLNHRLAKYFTGIAIGALVTLMLPAWVLSFPSLPPPTEDQIRIYETTAKPFLVAWFERNVDNAWNLGKRGFNFKSKEEFASWLLEPFNKKSKDGVFILERQLNLPSMKLYRAELIDGRLKLSINFRFSVMIKDSVVEKVFKGNKEQQVVIEIDGEEISNYFPFSEYWVEGPIALAVF